MSKQKEFTIFWRTGKREVIRGENLSQAIDSKNFSPDELMLMHFYVEGDVDDAVFVGGEWEPKQLEMSHD